jgi:hypothetical protein
MPRNVDLVRQRRWEVIVSGDTDLPALNPFRDIPIVTSALFVQGAAR